MISYIQCAPLKSLGFPLQERVTTLRCLNDCKGLEQQTLGRVVAWFANVAVKVYILNIYPQNHGQDSDKSVAVLYARRWFRLPCAKLASIFMGAPAEEWALLSWISYPRYYSCKRYCKRQSLWIWKFDKCDSVMWISLVSVRVRCRSQGGFLSLFVAAPSNTLTCMIKTLLALR